MESSNSDHLLQLYRDDRRKLLKFLVSSGFIKEITTPAGPTASISDDYFDSMSTDYVLECIQSGRVLDVSEARERYRKESSNPVMIRLQSGDTFYLYSDPESSGSPPRRAPPKITKNHTDFVGPCKFEQSNSLAGTKSHPSFQERRIYSKVIQPPDINVPHHINILLVGLPALKTGLSDDDLRESAYEVFLACILFSGFDIHPTDGRKREKSARFLTGLKSRRYKQHIESESPESHLKILDTIRTQMQISEVTDKFIRRRLTQFASGRSYRQLDSPQLSLVLLTGILRSDFQSEKSYLHWVNRQADVIQELVCSDHRKAEKQIVGASLAKLRNSEEWDTKMSPSQRSDALLAIRQVALTFSAMPGRFGIEGETYYWTTGYQLNIRLYEKLLLVVFDILEEGQLLEEAEEIMKLLKLTWSTLGITQRLHHALFAWVLFQQFVATDEAVLLDYAMSEADEFFSSQVRDEKELAYLRSLTCSSIVNGCEIRLDLVQSVLLSISSWCDSKLHDYHLHFSQKSSLFEKVVTMGLSTGIQDNFTHRKNNQFAGSGVPNEIVTEKVRTYVQKSLNAACKRVTDLATLGSMKDDMIHPLAMVASELKLIAEKDLSLFSPILSHWYPECAVVSTKTLHEFYGERLKPFLKDVTCLTEDVKKVLPAAYALEHCLIGFYASACQGNSTQQDQEFERYPIAEISRSIILDWVVAQHGRILEWTGRALDIEDWEPLSSQKKQAASAVEVFRIIEETVAQFFEWSLPMDITHLQALLSIIFHSLDAYLLKMVSHFVEKQKLYPSTPPLTRYKEAKFTIVKKKTVDNLVLDDEIYKDLDNLTTSKLCIRLNTYQYIQKQTTLLEEGIRNSWNSITSHRTYRCSAENYPETSDATMDSSGESVSELFVATLDCIKDSAARGIRQTCDFLGAKIVFWDLRDSFLYNLYHGGVERNRMEGTVPEFDKVLNNVCSLIDVTIRDLVVSSIWKEALEGFLWVLLDGGPSRAFSESDITMIEEDFIVLKELFVADGEGLPRSLVEENAKTAHQILRLFSLKTESLIQMLLASSEHISVGMTGHKYGHRYVGDAQTLIRVLCHKKDREASKFLKRHYHLPPSSEYGEAQGEESGFNSPLVADLLKKSTSFRWSEKSHSSFRSMKKRFQGASWDFKNVAW